MSKQLFEIEEILPSHSDNAFFPQSPQNKLLQEGLSHYYSPFKVYAYFFKQTILIMNAIFDTILYLPFRIIFNVPIKMFGRDVCSTQLKIDIMHALIVGSVIAIFNSTRYFELSLWYHNIRGQSQIKLYGILQILDLLDRSACNQGDYIMRKLYYGTVEKENTILNRYLLYSFLYVFIHSCILGLSFTVYSVIFSSGINLLYLAIFVLSLIKLKGSVFKKQDESACYQMLINDGREFFQKWLHIGIIVCTVKFIPDDFIVKLQVYLFIDIMVESFKYTQIVYLNKLPLSFFDKISDEICDLSYALSLSREYVGQNMAIIDQKNLNLVISSVPSAPLKMMGKLQFVVFPYVVLIFYALSYKLRRNNNDIQYTILVLFFVFLYLFSAIIKLLIKVFERHSNLFDKVSKERFTKKKPQ